MKRVAFSKEARLLLEANPHVVRYGVNTITYHGSFKLHSVHKLREGKMSPQAIFTEAGFTTAVVDNRRTAWLLRDWTKKYDAWGAARLTKESRGRKKKEKLLAKPTDRNSKEYIEWLEAENAFLRFLRYGKTD